MIDAILSSALREKAGADSYNRHEYQSHWIVYHMITKYKQNQDFVVFCEYHDDMSECEDQNNPNCMAFYQVKTSEKLKNWTLNKLFEREKKKDKDGNCSISFNVIFFDVTIN